MEVYISLQFYVEGKINTEIRSEKFLTQRSPNVEWLTLYYTIVARVR